jgi:hypothetical protein
LDVLLPLVLEKMDMIYVEEVIDEEGGKAGVEALTS